MIALKLTGGPQMAAALNALASTLRKSVLLEALKAAAEPMRARMAQLAPRRSPAPDLADNISISTATRIGSVFGGKWEAANDTEAAVAIGPSKDFFYGIFAEYGTVKQSAQPFMRPAFDSEAQNALDIFSARIWKVLERKGVRP